MRGAEGIAHVEALSGHGHQLYETLRPRARDRIRPVRRFRVDHRAPECAVDAVHRRRGFDLAAVRTCVEHERSDIHAVGGHTQIACFDVMQLHDGHARGRRPASA